MSHIFWLPLIIPISLLSLPLTVVDNVAHDQTTKFINDKNILYSYQSGLRKDHPWFFNDKILSFENGLSSGTILIDLKNAFDPIDYEINSSGSTPQNLAIW